ncbi:hypothetical protein [Caldalkalibacillus mannanilyticus]|uniref:hypothetical protein n=1 Tax=Caldalkalibacillus mannanilyticus TaxID=1418 RepID=UPI000469B27A|nr:hypothetical protein [Caldalkalibacillus mannanilyticus]
MEERNSWLEVPKVSKKAKVVVKMGDTLVDQELYPALLILNQMGIQTEYSCAGVSVLDEPEDHSLYAYVTIFDSPQAQSFISYIQEKMSHRVLISFEQERNRYDLSSFFIQHNRSFCHALYLIASQFQKQYFQERVLNA